MKIDEVKAAQDAITNYEWVVNTVKSVKAGTEDPILVSFWHHGGGGPSDALRIERDLVERMLNHALARAKSRLESLGIAG